MKGSFKAVCSLCLGIGATLPAVAQDAFPDTPANHWAYKALSKMKADGLLVGYPDGLFRGSRPASRYEMAVALHAVYANLKNLIDGLTTVNNIVGPISPHDLGNLKAQIAALQSGIDGMKGMGDDIANLRRASDTFEKELEQLGVDVEAMKHDLGSLGERVTKLENRRPPIDIHGDIDFWLGAGNSRDKYYGLNKDGRMVGTSSPGGVTLVFPPVDSPAGLERDLTILHEGAFTISGTDPKGPQWTGTVVIGNMFGHFGSTPPTVAFGNQSDQFNPVYGNANLGATGLLGYQSGTEDVYLQNAGVHLGSNRLHVDLGRLGYSVSPYMLQRADNTTYFSNERWDNGLYYFDGAILGFDFGPAKVDVFGGRNSGLHSMHGVEINPMRTGPLDGPFSGGPNIASGARFDIDRSVGANVKFKVGHSGGINLAYIRLESDTTTPIDLTASANRLGVFGGDGTFHFGSVNLEGGYHKSELQQGSTTVNSSDNSAWNVKLSTDRKAFSLFGEYREVEANYLAPGDWGRLGILRNPTNIKGFRVGGAVGLGSRFKLSASGEFDTGLSDTFAPSTFLGPDTNVDSYLVRLEYFAKRNLSLFGEYENAHFGSLAAPSNFAGSGDPSYRWTTFGLGYDMSGTSRFTIQYELSDVTNDYQATNGANFRGGFLTTQLSVKF